MCTVKKKASLDMKNLFRIAFGGGAIAAKHVISYVGRVLQLNQLSD